MKQGTGDGIGSLDQPVLFRRITAFFVDPAYPRFPVAEPQRDILACLKRRKWLIRDNSHDSQVVMDLLDQGDSRVVIRFAERPKLFRSEMFRYGDWGTHWDSL
jgi:hypothetical protein